MIGFQRQKLITLAMDNFKTYVSPGFYETFDPETLKIYGKSFSLFIRPIIEAS
jgi:hypothetical protein